jgi:hypothetical protein
MTNYTYYIGIDPGVNTGICVWSAADRHIRVIRSAKIHEAMNEVLFWRTAWPGKVFVRFEDARQRKWIPRQKNERAEKGLWAGAGSVKRDCTIWEDYLTSIGVPFEMVAPKNNRTKVAADYFKKLTGWPDKTNEHSRDAGMLVVGK